MNKFFPVIGGVSLIIFGIIRCFDPIFHDIKHGVTIDFTGFNIPFGLFCIIFGSLLLWSTFKKKKDDSSS